MARPVKKPSEQWKQEIMDAAQRLFMSNGYEETSISDIMIAVKGAKGTFYQFFETKGRLLEALVEKWAGAYKKAVIEILDDKGKSFSDKFSAMMAVIGQMSQRTTGMEFYFRSSNEMMIYRLTKRMTSMIVPYLEETLKAGINEGLFTLDNPRFHANFIIHGALGALNAGEKDANQNIQDNLNLLPQIIADILKIDLDKAYKLGEGR